MLFFVVMYAIRTHHAALGAVGGLRGTSWPVPVSVVVTVNRMLFGLGILSLATAYQPPCCAPCERRHALFACLVVAWILWNKSGAFRCSLVSVCGPGATFVHGARFRSCW